MFGHLAFAFDETEDVMMAHRFSTTMDSFNTARVNGGKKPKAIQHYAGLRRFRMFALIAAITLASANYPSHARADAVNPVFTLPASCGELLSDISPFLGFLEAVANGLANSDRNLSRRLLRLLSLRAEVLRNNERLRSDNGIDGTLRRALCFYREQREPLRPVTFDDEGFIRFLRESIGELEKKVESSIFDVELEAARRRQLENRLAKNRVAAERLELEANRAARTSYNRILEQARKKAK